MDIQHFPNYIYIYKCKYMYINKYTTLPKLANPIRNASELLKRFCSETKIATKASANKTLQGRPRNQELLLCYPLYFY